VSDDPRVGASYPGVGRVDFPLRAPWPDYVDVRYEAHPELFVLYQRTPTASGPMVPEATRSRARRLVEKLRILRTGLPLESIDFEEAEDTLRARLVMRVLHRDTGESIRVQSHFAISWYVLERAEQDVRGMFLHMVEHLVYDGLRHELDESLIYDGIRARDPHGKDE
jgi:hypothetical protein